MNEKSLIIHALCTSSEWYQLKKLSKQQHWAINYEVMFEKDWEEYQITLFGWHDPVIKIISAFNNQTHIGLDYYKENFSLKEINDAPYKEKLYKKVGECKKYVEWDILINNATKKVLIELDFLLCPRTCENFWQICTNHPVLSYENSLFHRAVPNSFIEGGLIDNDAKSIYRDYFPDENYKYLHSNSGVIGMSKSYSSNNGTCFYITLKPINFFNSKNVAFGRIVAGMDTIIQISKSQTINQRIIEEIKIIQSKDYFDKGKSKEQIMDDKSGYRDLANEILKYL